MVSSFHIIFHTHQFCLRSFKYRVSNILTDLQYFNADYLSFFIQLQGNIGIDFHAEGKRACETPSVGTSEKEVTRLTSRAIGIIGSINLLCDIMRLIIMALV